MRKTITTLFTILIFGIVYAQPIDTARFKLEFAPKLQNFHKITQAAIIAEPETPQIDFNYEIFPAPIELTYSTIAIKPVKFQTDVMRKLYRNFLKVGIGYPATPLAEICIHNFDNTKFSFGLNANHISSWAQPIGKKMKNYAYYPYSDTRIHLFFDTYLKNQTLYTAIDFNNEIAHLYGFSKELGYNEKYYQKSYRDTLNNSFNHLRAEIGLRSNYLQTDKKLKQDVRLNFDFLRTHQKDMENKIAIQTFFAYDVVFKKLNGYFRPQLNFDVDYFINNWRNEKEVPDATFNSFKIEFVPTFKFAVKEYFLQVGVGLPVVNSMNSQMNGNAQFPVFPVAEVQLGIVPGILSIYGGVDGNVKLNSLQSLLYENPFTKPQLDSLRFSKTQISIFGGVKGNLIKQLNYHISARYSKTKDMAFFFLDTLSLLNNQFDVVYDDVNVLNVCANINWQIVDKIYLNLEANYWGYYGLKNIAKPWYKPTWEVAFGGKYYLKEKFIFDINMKLGFDRWAYVPVLENDAIVFHIEKMKPMLNFGVGFEYLISKQFSAFAQVNNVGFQYFSNFYDFRNLGFNAVVGITYSFGDESLKKSKR